MHDKYSDEFIVCNISDNFICNVYIMTFHWVIEKCDMYVFTLFHGFWYDQTVSQIDEQRQGMKTNWYIS